MNDQERDISAQLEELLQFLYTCPIGLIDFDGTGSVQHLNPEAVNQLAARLGVSAFDNVFEIFETWWPELRDLVERDERTAGRLVDDHRITGAGAGPGDRWGLGVWVVSVAKGRHMMAVADLSQVTQHVADIHSDLDRFQSIANELPVVLWVQDQEGKQQWVNDTFCAFFGVSRDDMDSDRWQMLVHPDDAPAYIEAYMAAVRAHEPFQAATRVQDRWGRWRWFESWARPRFDPDGRFLGHIGVSADVTEAREAQDAVAALSAHHRFQVNLSDRLASMEDPVAIQATAANLLSQHLDASGVHYAEVDETGTHAIVAADRHREGRPGSAGRYRLDDYGPSVMDDVRAGRTVVVDDVATDSRLSGPERQATGTLAIGAYVMAPVVHARRAVAVMVARHDAAHQWTPAEIEAVKDSGQRTWLALERARLAHQSEARRNQAEFMSQILTDLAAHTEPARQYQYLAQALVPRFADYATVEAPDLDQPVLGIAHRDPGQVSLLRTLRHNHRIAPSDANSIARAARGEAQLLPEIDSAVRAEYAVTSQTRELLDRLAPRSHLAVPLPLGGGLDGALLLGLVEPERAPYTSADLDFISDLARRASVVIAETRLRRAEHDIAGRLQRALLPDSLHWLPTVAVEARYQSAADLLDVGGDWYDTFTWATGHVAVMVGDIVGHDISSAVAMGRLRSATAALATVLPPEPAVLLDALDQFAKGRDGTSFATAVCAVVDPATGILTYASAGHPPPLLIHPDGRTERLTGGQSPPLCSIAAGSRPQGQVALSPGTLVVLYSDGLIERRREPLDTGMARIERTAVEQRHQPLAEITEHILEVAIPPDGFEDDVVLALIRFTQPITSLQLSIPARSDQLARLRHDVGQWLDQRGLRDHLKGDILLAVSEAVTNAIEHAYLHPPDASVSDDRRIDIELHDHDYHLVAHIADHGLWRPPAVNPLRGRGTSIMQTIATHYARTSGGQGTTITLEIPTPTRHHAVNGTAASEDTVG